MAHLSLRPYISLAALPDEILLEIFQYLGHTDLLRCGIVNRKFNKISDDSTLWSSLLLSFPLSPTIPLSLSPPLSPPLQSSPSSSSRSLSTSPRLSSLTRAAPIVIPSSPSSSSSSYLSYSPPSSPSSALTRHATNHSPQHPKISYLEIVKYIRDEAARKTKSLYDHRKLLLEKMFFTVLGMSQLMFIVGAALQSGTGAAIISAMLGLFFGVLLFLQPEEAVGVFGVALDEKSSILFILSALLGGALGGVCGTLLGATVSAMVNFIYFLSLPHLFFLRISSLCISFALVVALLRKDAGSKSYLMFSATSAIIVGAIFGINAGVMVGAIQGSCMGTFVASFKYEFTRTPLLKGGLQKLGFVGMWSVVGAVASATAGGFGGAIAKKYKLDLEGQILLPLMDINWILPGVALGIVLTLLFSRQPRLRWKDFAKGGIYGGLCMHLMKCTYLVGIFWFGPNTILTFSKSIVRVTTLITLHTLCVPWLVLVCCNMASYAFVVFRYRRTNWNAFMKSLYFDRNSLLLLFWCGLIVGSFAGIYEGISENDGYLSEKTIFLLSAGMGAQLISMTSEVLF